MGAVRLFLREILDVNFKHRADKTITDAANIAPGRAKGVIDKRPELKNKLHSQVQVSQVSDLELIVVGLEVHLFDVVDGVSVSRRRLTPSAFGFHFVVLVWIGGDWKQILEQVV